MKFQKGISGNPKGRPKKGQTMTDVLRMAMESPVTGPNGNKMTLKEAMASKLIELAASGESWAIKYIYDRIDGSPRQVTELTGEEGDPIQVHFVSPKEMDTDNWET
jgi:hypothetical protein